MKPILLIAFLITLSFHVLSQEIGWEGPAVDFSHGKLVIAENNRLLTFEDGTPFFWMGDTAWEMFHRLTKDETLEYLENRREKGFNVIQAVVLAELDGLNTPNAEGNRPLIDNDPAKINEAYFEHVDWVIRKAEERGVFIGLLPTWGDKVDKKWGVGPVIFNEMNAFVYGQILGKRYRDFKNIIWINGGDRPGGGENFPVWDALARGIKSVDQNHLMTYHPSGESSSSKWFHDWDWLDFNMMQTGHGQRSYAIFQRLMWPDYNRQPVKPVLDGEPRYEDHPHNWKPETLGWFDDVDVRQATYWGVFSGGFGVTYGCHAIWQMLDEGRQPIGFARNSWRDDLDLPGAWDMIHLRRLMESRPLIGRVPFQRIIQNDDMPEKEFIVATKGANYVMIYIPTGLDVELDLDACGWKKSKAWWYNCRTGQVTKNSRVKHSGMHQFSAPTQGHGNDWVLVLDDVKSGFKTPAKLKAR